MEPTLAVDRYRPLVERIVNDELDRLIDRARAFPGVGTELARVSVVVEDDAPVDDPDLYGLYVGRPVTDDGTDDIDDLPPLVQIFLAPLLELATGVDGEIDRVVLEEEVLITIRHEIGHHFGLEHDRLDQLGLL